MESVCFLGFAFCLVVVSGCVWVCFVVCFYVVLGDFLGVFYVVFLRGVNGEMDRFKWVYDV